MKILSRSMKNPLPRSWKSGGWQDFIATMKIGECVELEGDNERANRRMILRAAPRVGFKVTTRKTVKGTLEVYRIA